MPRRTTVTGGKMVKVDRFDLPPDEHPDKWYNILPDLPEPLPEHKDPPEGPSRLEFIRKVCVGECLRQEFSDRRWIPIPDELLELYIHAGRPRPLYRALRLERRLGLKHVRISVSYTHLTLPTTERV